MTTHDAKASEVKGVFTLILYSNNMGKAAFFYKEDGRYTIEPYTPNFNLKIMKGISDSEAIQKAEDFVKGDGSFSHSQFSKIVDDNDQVVGFELRPLYYPLSYGVSDILDISYKTKGNKVIAYISLVSSVKDMLF
ncbi:MAG: hypothetical protein HQL10_03470 [Nitrospirae bacterium]|nr:hypothetical protein [Nitrospirota bacterium]